jgi:hypothetical protein
VIFCYKSSGLSLNSVKFVDIGSHIITYSIGDRTSEIYVVFSRSCVQYRKFLLRNPETEFTFSATLDIRWSISALVRFVCIIVNGLIDRCVRDCMHGYNVHLPVSSVRITLKVVSLIPASGDV